MESPLLQEEVEEEVEGEVGVEGDLDLEADQHQELKI